MEKDGCSEKSEQSVSNTDVSWDKGITLPSRDMGLNSSAADPETDPVEVIKATTDEELLKVLLPDPFVDRETGA